MIMNRNSERATVLSGFLWRWLERVGAQGVQFIVALVLARVLAPEIFGTVALINVFIAILQVFVDSGLGNSLIQKKDADDLDFSTVFYFNICMCCLLYLGMFFAAPAIADFYNSSDLVSPIRAISLILIISGVKNVQQAYVSRTMQFRKFFFATLGGTIGAAVIGIWMAYAGYGVWALIAQSLFNATVDTIILWCTVRWRPKKVFSWRRLIGLFSYGWKLLISSLLDTGYIRLREMIIGKLYSPASLAYYERGGGLPANIVSNIDSSINSVLFPAMSSEQENRERVRDITRRAMKVSSYIMWPIMMGLSACAGPLVSILLTDKWLPCVPFMRIFCITYAFYPVHTANLNAIKALGRSDIFLKLEIFKKIIGIILLILSIPHGVMVMAYSLLISSFASQLINSWPNRKLLNYSYSEQIKDILPSILLSLFMSAVVWCCSFLPFGIVAILLLQISVGIFIYIVGSVVFRIDSFGYMISVIKQILKKKDKS